MQAICLLVTEAAEVAKCMANLTLVLASWTSQTFSVEESPPFVHLSCLVAQDQIFCHFLVAFLVSHHKTCWLLA